ncbi:hypothetical protein K493DRAFT_304210 [Basidiobolus meristosporus CBS 931.73]|uniref:Uncharacterized protein n=1 Tax=Basidiobolus meristosporus CBS 931.73 TaxID=1314790 RepID=A0A1Y1XZS6_9FUNG|nr:hypothetical protein K493DRAFT_304210 [Basidiobolus meristosporus CBS 931.73]|eukprot:ORX91241.1 hypothetical protein K493DRAFT_304210 [Basidiobolus meristosporus CBS 931.73]
MIRKIGNNKDLAKIISQRMEITEKNLQTKVINPVCASPLKIIKSKPKNKQSDDNKEKKITFFTKSVPTNQRVKMLHDKASTLKDLSLRYNPNKETCLTDVRTMLTQYINLSNLKTDVGMYMDNFLAELLDLSEFPLLKHDKEKDQKYIAKDNRKTIIAMARKVME